MSQLTKEILDEIDKKSTDYLMELCRISRENNLDEMALVETGLFWCRTLINEYKKERERINEQKPGNNDH